MRGIRAFVAVAVVGIATAAWSQDTPSPPPPSPPPAATPLPDAAPTVPSPPPPAAATPPGNSAADPRAGGPDRRGPPAAKPSAPATASASTAIKRITPEAMAEILRDAGYRAQIVANPGKKPFLRTGMSSRRVTVNFYDCKDEGCQSLQYRVVFNKSAKLSIGFANAWNLKKRFAKAYVDGDGEMSFEWDVDLDGGVSSAYITQTALTFDDLIGLFDAFEP